MAFTYAILGDNQNHWFVLSFRVIQAGDPELQKAQVDASLLFPGTVYRFDVFQADKNTEQRAPDFRKRLLPIFNRRFLFVDPMNRLVLQRHEDQAVWSRAVLSV